MGIDEKPTAAWTEADLQELCDERRREQPTLEFKEKLQVSTDAEKKRVERAAQGLANAGSGHLIYGIAEEQLDDGSKVASRLVPLTDGGLYEQLNNVLDSRGDPRIPFELYAITATNGGLYMVVEVHGGRGPHMASDGRYYIRRNLLVRQMTEAEVSDSYRQRFERERRSLEPMPPSEEEPDARVRHGLTPTELAIYNQETGDPEPPGWLSIWVYPTPLQPQLFDPRHVDSHEFRSLGVEGLWRRNESPLEYFNLRKVTDGFVAQLPPGDDAYPEYFVRVWADGLLEWGDLQAPVIRRERLEENRYIATHAVAEYTHDFLLAARELLQRAGWQGETVAQARLDHIAGYRIAVDTQRVFRGDLIAKDDQIASLPWRGHVFELDRGAVEVARDLSDRVFISGGVEQGAYFFDSEGNYTG